jgi:ketosteroid isomerase-like protein
MSNASNLPTAEQAIRIAVDEFTKSYNSGDLKNLTSIFAEDLIDMSAGGPTRRGEEARKHFVSRVSSTHQEFRPHLVIEIDEIQVAGSWAYQRGSLVVTLQPKAGGETSYIRQRYLEIWRRDAANNWKIAIEMDNSEGS